MTVTVAFVACISLLLFVLGFHSTRAASSPPEDGERLSRAGEGTAFGRKSPYSYQTCNIVEQEELTAQMDDFVRQIRSAHRNSPPREDECYTLVANPA